MVKENRHDTVAPDQKYEEYKVIPQFLGWVLLLGFSAALIVWAVWLHLIIPDLRRYWDFGATAFTPAESIYSTVVVPAGAPPIQQIHVLPEAKPLRPPGEESRGEEP